MKRLARLFIFFLPAVLLFACQKEDLFQNEDTFYINKDRKLKRKLVYSSSKAEEPYARTDYYYDRFGNLIKELITVDPDPVTFKNIFMYDQKGRLLEKRHYGIPQGASSTGLTEDNLTLYTVSHYSYPDENTKVETIYLLDEFEDSTVYEYENNLLIKETHFKKSGSVFWYKTYTYDEDGNLIQDYEEPGGTKNVYTYKDGHIVSMKDYVNDSLRVVNDYVYHKEGTRWIVEVNYSGPYGNFISEKSTYEHGLLIEYIKYHPTFIGAEWFCARYEYY